VTARGRGLEHDFPDYRVVLPRRGAHRVTVDVAELRRDLAAAPAIDGPDEHVSVLTLGADGRLTAMPSDDSDVRIGVNREFLLQALAATGRRQLALEFGGPITPLAVRVPDDEGLFSLLMPVRL
jgi:DNA polymerase III sliding clamp (beta) subunit (PCNA family)